MFTCVESFSDKFGIVASLCREKKPRTIPKVRFRSMLKIHREGLTLFGVVANIVAN